MLIRLRGCAGWSAPLLFAFGIRHIFAWPDLTRIMWALARFTVRDAYVRSTVSVAPIWEVPFPWRLCEKNRFRGAYVRRTVSVAPMWEESFPWRLCEKNRFRGAYVRRTVSVAPMWEEPFPWRLCEKNRFRGAYVRRTVSVAPMWEVPFPHGLAHYNLVDLLGTKLSAEKRNNLRQSAFHSHLLRAEVAVCTCAIPVPLHRFRVQGYPDPILLRYAVQKVTAHPQLVSTIDPFTRANLVLPL